jgi:hypothetical protein
MRTARTILSFLTGAWTIMFLQAVWGHWVMWWLVGPAVMLGCGWVILKTNENSW